MEAYTAYLFAALAIVGGVIAWLGDVIGARLGKKRRSLFGLRPRQTARLVAVLIGAALPLAGLLVATVGSEYARQAVFEMDSLLGSIEDLRAQVDDFREQADAARVAAAEARDQARASADRLTKAQERVTSLEDVQDSLESQVDGLQSQASRLESQVTQRERDVAQARDDLAQARTNLAEAEEAVTTAEAKLRHVDQELGLTGDQLDQARRKLEQAREDVVDAALEVERKLERLQILQADLDETQRQLDELRERDRLIAHQRPLFDLEDELWRDLVDGDDTQDQVEAALIELLHLASLVAERAEVPVGPNGRAVRVVAPVPKYVAPGEQVSEALIISYVSTLLRAEGAGQWVVGVQTFRRFFKGDEGQLEVRYWARPNVKVFEKGEVLAELAISAEATTAEIFTAIYRTITDRTESPVRIMAIARRMLPDSETGNYGQIDLNEIFEAAAKVQRRRGMVPVRIVAKHDTYTIGPLLIELQVGNNASP